MNINRQLFIHHRLHWDPDCVHTSETMQCDSIAPPHPLTTHPPHRQGVIVNTALTPGPLLMQIDAMHAGRDRLHQPTSAGAHQMFDQTCWRVRRHATVCPQLCRQLLRCVSPGLRIPTQRTHCVRRNVRNVNVLLAHTHNNMSRVCGIHIIG